MGPALALWLVLRLGSEARPCTEVRRATDEDPESKQGNHSYCGTPTLRASMHAQYKNQAFSLIFPTRTLDFQVETEQLCNTYVRCFQLLVEEAHH